MDKGSGMFETMNKGDKLMSNNEFYILQRKRIAVSIVVSLLCLLTIFLFVLPAEAVMREVAGFVWTVESIS